MRISILLLLTSSLLLAAPIKVAVIGDSITFGSGAKAREYNRYSTRLGHLLGENYNVKTFGASSLCMLRNADLPFVKSKLFRQALHFKPDMAIITLGTNDTCQNDKRKNWQHNADLQSDSEFLIGKLLEVNPQMIIHLCSPPPMFPNQPGLKSKRKKDLTERSQRLSAIRQAYAQTASQYERVYFHDLTRALRKNETTDGVHPHTFGHERMAHHYHELVTRPTGQRAQHINIPSNQSEWHGFNRHDFRLPKTGARCTLVLPHTPAKGLPWIWRARFFGHQPALDLALLDRGYHLAYVDVADLFGAKEAIKRCDEFYRLLTSKFDLRKKCIMEGMSRGGLLIFNYAAKYPHRVSAIYADNPVCNFNSWPGGKHGKFSEREWKNCLKAYGISAEQAPHFPQISDEGFTRNLAQRKIPMALVLGTEDKVVPPAENGELVARHYASAGGPIKVWRKPGKGHHPHGLAPVDALLRFLLRAEGKIANPASHPKPSSEYRSGAGWKGHWWQAFDHLKAEVKKHPDTKFVFLGDSITQSLTGHGNRAASPTGQRAIDKHYGKTKTLSLGLSGDRTEHILWRLQHEQLDNINPTHLVLMIGVNNILTAGHTGEEIASGTEKIVNWFKKHRPNTKVLLLGCFPTQKAANHPARVEVDTLHRLIKPLADSKTIYYQDLRPIFLNTDGTMNDCMSHDAVHINAKGQEAWMNALKPFFSK